MLRSAHLIGRLALAVVLAACAPPATPPTDRASAAGVIEGAARITDGDTLTIGAARIRLFGIDTPELRQRCGAGAGWPCGEAARNRLAALTAGQQVSCIARDRDRFERIVAVCAAGGLDLGRTLVREGLAVAFIRYSRDYVAEEAEASAARHGMWSGPFTSPEDWRAGHR